MGGYCPNTEGDCYKMYDPINNVIYCTRDVIWLRRMYWEKTTEASTIKELNYNDIIKTEDDGDRTQGEKRRTKQRATDESSGDSEEVVTSILLLEAEKVIVETGDEEDSLVEGEEEVVISNEDADDEHETTDEEVRSRREEGDSDKN